MKRSILVPIAGFAIAIGIIGSGFSTWYFLDNEISSEANVNIGITDKLDGKGYIERSITYIDSNGKQIKAALNDDDKFDICLDQGQKDILDDSHINDANYNQTGIYFEYANQYKVEYLHLDYLVPGTMYDAITKQGIKASYNTVVTINSPLSNYIDIKNSIGAIENSSAVIESPYYVYPSNSSFMIAANVMGPYATSMPKTKETIGGTSYYRFKMTVKLGVDENNSSYIFEYKAGKKPTNKNELETMRNELDATSNKLLTFEAKVDFTK